MGWKDKLRQALGGEEPEPEPEQPQTWHPFAAILAQDSPSHAVHSIKEATFFGGGHRMMHLGALETAWVTTPPDGHVLALAPPRSHAGKTSSLMIPLILSTFDRVVATSTKPDIIRATALCRAQYGTVWCYAPDGETPIPPGVRVLRWSPLAGAEDWGVAVRTANDMTKTLSSAQVEGGTHWLDRARDVLSSVFHWAAIRGYDMRRARDSVLQLQKLVDDPVNPGKDVMLGKVIARALAKDKRANSAAGPTLDSVMATGYREMSSIVSSASRALQVYQLPGAIASTEDPNFDPAAFVAGAYGRSTVYIMSSNEAQEITSPLVVAFLNQIRQAQYRQQRQYAQSQMTRTRTQPSADDPFDMQGFLAEFQQDMTERVQSTSTTVFALDELYGIAPIPDIANMLSEGGSQGVLVAGAVQDLALIKARWKTAGESFMTLFGDILVFPGIRHGDTLEAVSKLIGDYDREMPTTSVGNSPQGTTYTTGTSIHRERRMPPDQVALGPVPQNQDVVLHLSGQGVGQLWATPYWRAQPWPQVVTSAMCNALGSPVSMWAQGAKAMGRSDVDEPPLTSLPIPDLTWWAEHYRGQDPWADAYIDARRRWEARFIGDAG